MAKMTGDYFKLLKKSHITVIELLAKIQKTSCPWIRPIGGEWNLLLNPDPESIGSRMTSDCDLKVMLLNESCYGDFSFDGEREPRIAQVYAALRAEIAGNKELARMVTLHDEQETGETNHTYLTLSFDYGDARIDIPVQVTNLLSWTNETYAFMTKSGPRTLVSEARDERLCEKFICVLETMAHHEEMGDAPRTRDLFDIWMYSELEKIRFNPELFLLIWEERHVSPGREVREHHELTPESIEGKAEAMRAYREKFFSDMAGHLHPDYIADLDLGAVFDSTLEKWRTTMLELADRAREHVAKPYGAEARRFLESRPGPPKRDRYGKLPDAGRRPEPPKGYYRGD